MSKMTVIQLLNKIANGEEVPKIIKYDETIYYFRNYDYKEYSIEKDYCDEQTSWIEDKFDFYKINDEVEIIKEDKKIEPILIWKEGKDLMTKGIEGRDIVIGELGKIIISKINEIIDKLNEMEKE